MTGSDIPPRGYDAVLLPLDGSSIAARAIPTAVSFAREVGCKLVLLHVLPPVSTEADQSRKPVNGPRERQVHKSQMEGYLLGLQRSLSKSGVSTDIRIEVGDPCSMILKVAQLLGRVMLVLTDSGLSASRHEDASYREGAVHASVVAAWNGPLLEVDV